MFPHSLVFLKITWSHQEMGPWPYLITGLYFMLVLALDVSRLVTVMGTRMHFLSSPQSYSASDALLLGVLSEAWCLWDPWHAVTGTDVHPALRAPWHTGSAPSPSAWQSHRPSSWSVGTKDRCHHHQFISAEAEISVASFSSKGTNLNRTGCHCAWHPS